MKQTMRNTILLSIAIFLGACTHRIELASKEPININMNLTINHKIQIQVSKDLEDVFSENKDVF